MNIGLLIVARLSSSRLPAKNLKPILGKPMIEHLIERTRAAKTIQTVAIATSTESSDDPLEKFGREKNVPVFRGSLDSVMDRIDGAAKHFGFDAVVEILGDNPLVHSDLIDDVVIKFREENLDYCANITNEYKNVEPNLKRFPIGVRVQVYKTALAAQSRLYPEFEKKDLGTSAYMFYQPEKFRCGYLSATGKWEVLNKPEYHFAVNYQKNFDLIEKIISELYPHNKNFSLQDVMAFMKSHPELESLMGG